MMNHVGYNGPQRSARELDRDGSRRDQLRAPFGLQCDGCAKHWTTIVVYPESRIYIAVRHLLTGREGKHTQRQRWG